ncbi:winged helix-turn-helix transcriptional regulator [Photobacterium phosphoreum]|uniref:winged helix-turn-helix transcriptional regulator n=1 Tax=Photobacterium phosphoreum TaxID=659 RepID=UPI0015E79B10|nr:winged helix-turn-helix transcriptional regulator [Photobacterium phosphoreum]
MSNAQVLISQYQIYTSKQLVTTAKSLDTTDSIRKTYVAIATSCDFSNKTYTSKISYARIAERVGLSIRQVMRHVQELLKLGVFTSKATGYICKRSGQRRQSSNKYQFNLDVIKGYCAQLQAKCHAHMSQVVESTKPPQINIDQDSFDSSQSEAKAKASHLMSLVRFKTEKDAWENRGRRYVDSKTGGIFIHSSHSNDPTRLIGYIEGSIAANYVVNMLTDYSKLITD